MIATISVLAKNEPGVLADLAQEFKRFNANIMSISSGLINEPGISRIIICVEAEPSNLAGIKDAIETMEFVVAIEDMSKEDLVVRELVLIRVHIDRESTPQIMQILEIFRAGIVGMGKDSLVIEMSGDSGRVDGLIRMLEPFGIVKMSRTGKIAIKRGDI
ncbi:MAG TPA: acetolactate synthase small subunit [Desulfomicrobiaceae bacterium]|nr:acetolactate synthase small subunit [Desulfomicrobiaceae bacterium]